MKTAPKNAAVSALAASQLRWICDPASLGFQSTAELDTDSGIVGQNDALEALRYGLETSAPGQNIFVRGLMGTGRLELVKRVLAELNPVCSLGTDFCYVGNFKRPDEPRLLALPRGRGAEFRDAIEALVQFLKTEFQPPLQSELMSPSPRHQPTARQARRRAAPAPCAADGRRGRRSSSRRCPAGWRRRRTASVSSLSPPRRRISAVPEPRWCCYAEAGGRRWQRPKSATRS